MNTPDGSVLVVTTSIQLLHSYSGWESWNNMPGEKAKMIALAQAHVPRIRVVFLSGDVHWGEVSMDGGLYDITSSGISHIDPQLLPNTKYALSSLYYALLYDVFSLDVTLLYSICCIFCSISAITSSL